MSRMHAVPFDSFAGILVSKKSNRVAGPDGLLAGSSDLKSLSLPFLTLPGPVDENQHDRIY